MDELPITLCGAVDKITQAFRSYFTDPPDVQLFEVEIHFPIVENCLDQPYKLNKKRSWIKHLLKKHKVYSEKQVGYYLLLGVWDEKELTYLVFDVDKEIKK
jgi:hypothetical protein